MNLQSVALSWILVSSFGLAPAPSVQGEAKREVAPPAAKQEPASKPASAPADSKFTKEERAKIVKLLRDSQRELLDAVEKLDDSQWTWKPAADKWSIGEIVEHLGLVETRISGAIDRALADKPDPEWRTKTAGKNALIERALPDRTTKVKAPEPVTPTGTLSRADAMEKFKKSRAKNIEFAESTDVAVKAFVFDHPFFGPLNVAQWLLVVPLHNQRHFQQVLEVKATRGFPAK